MGKNFAKHPANAGVSEPAAHEPDSRRTRLRNDRKTSGRNGSGKQTPLGISDKAKLFNLSYEPIFVWSPEAGIVEWNRGSEKLYGYTKAEALGRNVHELLRTVHILPPVSRLSDLARGGQWTAELQHTTKDGREVIVECRQQLIAIGSRHLVVETNRDITEEKRMDAERREILRREKAAREEAEHANRAKDEFLAMLSHELRTPLHSIKGWISILQKGEIDAETQKHGLEVIARNVNSQNALIEDILDVSRIVLDKLSLEIARLSLASLVRNAVDEAAIDAEAGGIDLQAEIDDSADEMDGDGLRLRQIVNNLLNNAIKFTPSGGRVTLRLTRCGRSACLSVSDTGTGISPEILPRIFDRFRQADSTSRRSHSGLGLGLAIAKHLAELHGGKISAHSEGPGHGSTFTIELPLAAESVSGSLRISNEPAACHSAESPHPLGGARLLLVDDDPDALNMLRVALESSGASVTCESSARQALERIRDGQFDLLLSDIGMAEMDGYDLIRAVRETIKIPAERLPAIALSGYVSVEDRDKSLSSGYQMHVAKPVDLPALSVGIGKLITREP